MAQTSQKTVDQTLQACYCRTMQCYQTHTDKLSGTDLKEVIKKASQLYDEIIGRTKRRPYIRSKYFNKEKIFLGLFWEHLHGKLNHRDKLRRIKLFPLAIDLIKNTKIEPISKENVDKTSEILHRFIGRTKDKEIFFVQIKESKRSKEKFFISVFPL